jgi:hypothetical protein
LLGDGPLLSSADERVAANGEKDRFHIHRLWP